MGGRFTESSFMTSATNGKSDKDDRYHENGYEDHDQLSPNINDHQYEEVKNICANTKSDHGYERVPNTAVGDIYERAQTYERAQIYESAQTYERTQTYESAQTFVLVNHQDDGLSRMSVLSRRESTDIRESPSS